MPRKRTSTNPSHPEVKEVTLTRAITVNLGDFESMRFEMTATAEIEDNHTAPLESWLSGQLDEWITSEIDPINIPMAGPKPAGQVAKFYKERTSD